MRTVRVGDVAEQLRGVTFAKSDAVSAPRDGYLPVLTAGNIQEGRLVTDELTYVPIGKVRDKQRVRKNDIVVCTSSGSLRVVGKAARSRGGFTGGFGAFLKVLRPGTEVDPGYFAHFFQTTGYRRKVSQLAAGANINNLKNEHLDNLALPLPSLDEQRRIAAILDQADALRAERRQALVHLDDLTQAIFVSMFKGDDPPRMSAGELMPAMRNGLSPATAGQCSATVLTLSAVTRGRFDPTAVKPGMFASEPPGDKRVSGLDFLMCRGNGNKALVGVGTFSREDRADLVFPDTVIAGRIDPSLVSMDFLEVAWRQKSTRSQIEALARTTNGTYKVNQQSLATVAIPIPPLRSQQEFAARAACIQQQRGTMESELTKLDDLFASLQHQAFRGEA